MLVPKPDSGSNLGPPMMVLDHGIEDYRQLRVEEVHIEEPVRPVEIAVPRLTLWQRLWILLQMDVRDIWRLLMERIKRAAGSR